MPKSNGICGFTRKSNALLVLRNLRSQAGVLSLNDLVCIPSDRILVEADIGNTALAVDVRSVLFALWPGVAFEFPSEVPPPGLFIPVGLARTYAQLR